MKIVEIKKLAIRTGIVPGKMRKAELIHAIQIKEGNYACFQIGLRTCDQYKCSWRSDCFPAESKDTNKKESYKDKIKADLEEFKDKLEVLKLKAQQVVGKAKKSALAEIKNLEEKCEEEIKQKLNDLAEAGEESWLTAKKGIDRSWEDLKKSAQKILSKLNRK